jgi:hypothetical protein
MNKRQAVAFMVKRIMEQFDVNKEAAEQIFAEALISNYIVSQFDYKVGEMLAT